MAIDTAIKRASALLEPGQLPWPPDGEIEAEDRAFALEFYAGFDAAEEVLFPRGPVKITLYAYTGGAKQLHAYQAKVVTQGASP